MKSLIKTLKFIIHHPLGSHNKFRSISRYFLWQIISRICTGPIKVKWIEQSILCMSQGDTGLTGNLYVGLHEFQDMGFLLHLLRPEDLFVDVGSNAGSFTILASSVVKARSIAIEPIPDTFNRLQLNISSNNLTSRVNALNIGLSNSIGRLSFTKNLDCMNHVISVETSSDITDDLIAVDVSTLDSVLESESVVLVKIDVEGYELSVLKGGEELLKSESLLAVILEINPSSKHYGILDLDITLLLNSYGFWGFKYDPIARNLQKISRNFDLEGNIIFIKNIEEVEERIRSSRHYSINGYTI